MKPGQKSLNPSASPAPVECRAPRRGGSPTRTSFLFAAVAAALLAGASGAATTAPDDGPAYPVSQIAIRYSIRNRSLRNLGDVMNLKVSLGLTDTGYVEARPGAATVALSLKDIGAGAGKVMLHQSAIRSISAQIVHYLNQQGLYGVFVSPDPADIPPETGQDLRPEKRPAADQQILHLVIYVGKVTRTRTIASGGRIPAEERIDNPAHAWIKQKSPLQPGAESGPSSETDLFRKDLLDDYLFELNRLPGLRVDAAIASGGAPGDVALDYLVNESKPWLAYYQLSNTGTKQTSKWRDRVGFTDNQLTGHNDTLTLDALGTGVNNDDTRAISGSYELPILAPDLLRLHLYGSWSKYSASDVGFFGEEFVGTDWTAGAEIIGTVFQHKQWFLDAAGGARWHSVTVNNEVVDVSGHDNFFIPNIGLRLDHITPTATTQASVGYEWNIPDVANTQTAQMPALGRLQTDTSWWVVKWNARQSFFLEPLLAPAGTETTLAHEIVLGFRGQWTRDRLIPQEEEVAGGLYSVRGYPESDSVGDTVLIANLEYDLHVPRMLAPSSAVTHVPLLGDFRCRPPQRSVAPDWDFIIRPFLDVGRTVNTDRLSIEQNETLVGGGIGAELQIRRNLSVRCDWGFALKSTQDVSSGSNVLHFVLTLTY